jgi:hypothetical protein
MSTGKKLAVPNSFFGPSFLPENPFCKALLEPVISSFDSGSFSLRHVSQRGDPFSHPSGSSAQITKEPFCPVFVCFLHIKSFWVFVFSCLSCDGQRAHPATAGPETVQCRSVFIQLIRVVGSSAPVARRPPSNPFLTHVTVKSPAKLLSGSSTTF